jgi:hypothetical protein
MGGSCHMPSERKDGSKPGNLLGKAADLGYKTPSGHLLNSSSHYNSPQSQSLSPYTYIPNGSRVSVTSTFDNISLFIIFGCSEVFTVMAMKCFTGTHHRHLQGQRVSQDELATCYMVAYHLAYSDMSLQNVICFSVDYMALYRRRQDYLHPHCLWHPISQHRTTFLIEIKYSRVPLSLTLWGAPLLCTGQRVTWLSPKPW